MPDAYHYKGPIREYATGNRHLPLIRTKDAPGWLSIGVGWCLFILALAVICKVLF